MAKKKKNTELTEEQKAFNKKMEDFRSRANRLAEEIAHFLICSPLWPTVPKKNRNLWLYATCFPFVDIQKRGGVRTSIKTRNNMSKRNNKKKGKQEITQEQLHAMAKAWRADNEAGRVVVLFSLSECETVCANMLGAHRNLHKLIAEEVIPALQRVCRASPMPSVEQPRPSLWQRIRDWFFPFFKI